MFKSITWSNYWTFILIILVIYYVIICCLYYLNEIKKILSGRSNLLVGSNSTKNFLFQKITDGHNDKKNDSISDFNNHSTSQNELYFLIKSFAGEIKNSLEQAVTNTLTKQEVIYSLQLLAKKYYQIKDSPMQSFITNYILVESSNYSSIHLSEEDLDMLWMI